MSDPNPDQPLQFVPDTVEGSELEHGYISSSKVRGGLVVGLHGDASAALDQILSATGMPKFGAPLLVNGRTLYLRTIRAKAVSQDSARVALVYDNDFGANFQSAYIIRNNSYLTPYETNLVPGTRTPIRVSAWTNPGDNKDKAPADNVTFTFQMPMREIEVSGIKGGTPPSDDHYEKNVGYANDAVFKGLPIGYWVITKGGMDLSKYKGFYNWNLSALSHNTEDWSQTGILRNVHTGRYVAVRDQDVTDLIALPYSYGVIGQRNGIIRVGPYPVTSFGALFGFSGTGFGNILNGLDEESPSNT